jgi:hypothetical protein
MSDEKRAGDRLEKSGGGDVTSAPSRISKPNSGSTGED